MSAPTLARGAGIGDSIAINGVCLTVVDLDAENFTFDLSAETLRVTDLGALEVGDRVNLEPALRVGETLGGHFVSGHVDAVGEIIDIKPEGDCFVYKLKVGEQVTGLVIDRGSIAIDGISLTVTKIDSQNVEVVIIPHTAEVTTLGFKGPGDKINVEIDMIGKYVAKLVGKPSE